MRPAASGLYGIHTCATAMGRNRSYITQANFPICGQPRRPRVHRRDRACAYGDLRADRERGGRGHRGVGAVEGTVASRQAQIHRSGPLAGARKRLPSSASSMRSSCRRRLLAHSRSRPAEISSALCGHASASRYVRSGRKLKCAFVSCRANAAPSKFNLTPPLLGLLAAFRARFTYSSSAAHPCQRLS